jgi:hypothetical protein
LLESLLHAAPVQQIHDPPDPNDVIQGVAEDAGR